MFAGKLVAAIVRWSRRRTGRRELPRFEIVPAVPHCHVRDAADLAAAWRAAGFRVDLRGRTLEVRTPDGALAVIELPPSRRLGDAPFEVRSQHGGLVHDLATVAAYELGPLVCSIDGYVHGFDVPDPPVTGDGDGDGGGSATVQLRTGK